MRRKVLSLALSAGLMTATVSTAFAQGGGSGPDMGLGEGGRPMTRAEMIKAVQDFCNETQREWSILGFNSAAQARSTLGDSQSDWLTKTSKMLGISAATACTQVAGMTGGQSGQTGQTGQQGGQTGQQGGQQSGGQQGPTRQGETGGQQGETGPGGSGNP